MRKIAFTLAETLITLAIIGIVAAITIPSLNNNIKNEQLVTALKKDYSTLSQTTQMIVAENGGSIKGLCNSNNCLRDLYEQHIKSMKTCDSTASLDICWHTNSGKHIAYWLSGEAIDTWPANMSVIILPDGGFIRFSDNAQNCDGDINNILKEAIGCGRVAVDLNGFTPPNTVGRDIFYFALLENRIVPFGSKTDIAACTATSQGIGCARPVLTKGTMDY